MGYFTHDFRGNQFTGTDKPWLFTSGCRGLIRCETPLIDDTKENEGVYTVRLGFAAEPDDQPGQRVFNITLQGVVVLENFDIVKTAGPTGKIVIKEFIGVKVSNTLSLELIPQKKAPSNKQAPLVNFIEILRENNMKTAESLNTGNHVCLNSI